MVNRGELQRVTLSGKVYYRPGEPATFGRMIDRVQATVDRGDIVVRESVQLTRERLRDLQHDYAGQQEEIERLRQEKRRSSFSWGLMFTAATITAVVCGGAAMKIHGWYENRGVQIAAAKDSLAVEQQLRIKSDQRVLTVEERRDADAVRNAEIIRQMLRDLNRQEGSGTEKQRRQDLVGEAI